MYIEHNIIKYIQSFGKNNIQFFGKNIIMIMNLISGAIYSKIFLCTIIIFYLLKLFNTKQFILLILVNFIVGIIKYMIKRNRPYINDPEIKLYDENIIDKYSFPSGHATFSFMIYFILLDNNFINKYYIIFPLLVCFSRVMLGAHYISDVIGGIILAKLLSLLVL